MFNSGGKNISIATNPDNAEIYVDGLLKGRTPAKIYLDKDQSYTVELRKEGYESQFATIKSKVGAGWIVLDLVTTGGLGIIVDAITGDWKGLSPKSVSVEMIEKNQ